MDLLSGSDRRIFRDAIKDVTDTFMKTEVIYFRSQVQGSTNHLWGEDRKQETFQEYTIYGLKEDGMNQDDVERSSEGSADFHHTHVTFNAEDLDAAELMTEDWKFAGDPTKDYVKIKDQIYRLLDVRYDGPLDEKDILVVIRIELDKDPLPSL